MSSFEPAEKASLGVDGLDFVDHPATHKTIADPLLASSLVPGSPLFERFRVLRAKVKTIGTDRPFRCIAAQLDVIGRLDRRAADNRHGNPGFA